MEGADRRVRRTKSRLRQALAQLLLEKDLSSITVRELTELADVNRGTFYTHYKDLYDMLEQMENEMFQELEDRAIARLAGLINSPGAEAVTPDQADDCIEAILRHGRVKEEKEVVQMDDGQWAEYIRSTIAARKQNR